MLRGKYSFLVLLIGAFFLISADTKPEKPLYYFNSLKALEGFKLSHKPGVYEGDLTLKIESDRDDLDVQLITKDRYKRVDGEVTITEPVVLRIAYRDNEGKKRNFVGTYIVNQGHELPVVSLIVDTNDFFPPNGIYEGHMEPNPEGGDPLTVGKAWLKQPITAYAQFFLNNKLQEELELDLKTYGGMTLGWKEKSLQLSARKALHGEGKINTKLFENLPFRKFQHVVLRTSGNDQNKTRLKDMSISMVADDIKVNTKASRAVVVYINGQYWGIHNLREKVNGDYFKYRYDWKNGEFIEIQGSGFKDPYYRPFIDWVREHVNDQDFHQRVSDSIDVENFFNFNIIQTYISNVDYRGNIRFFKKKGDKWKWVLYDVDLACDHGFLTRNFIRDRTFPVHEYWYNPSYAVTLLNNMLKNKDFKERFIHQYTYLMATYVRPENFAAKMDRNSKMIASELKRHLARRNNLYNESVSGWESKVRTLKSYFEKRPESAYKHLKEVFALSDPSPLKVRQNIPLFKGLTANGSIVTTSNIDGKFFKEFPLEIQVVEADHLYRFVKWNDGVKEMKRKIIVGEKPEYIAEFEHIDTSSLAGRLTIDKYYVNNDKKDPLIFISLVNNTPDVIDMKDVMLFEDVTGASIDLKGRKLDPGKAVVLTNDCELFKEKYTKNTPEVVNFMEGTTFADDVKIALIEKNKGWIDSLQVNLSDSLVIEHPGYLATKDSSGVIIEPLKIKNMEKLKFGVDVDMALAENKESDSPMALIWGGIALVLGAVLWFILRKRKAGISVIILLLGFGGAAFAQAPVDSTVDSTTRVMADQFGISSVEKRIIDNKGNGDERFYGTRNFRVVLYDLVYRGGGNNLHLRDTIPKYYLWNPMPVWGLSQLHDIGFDKAVYLYSYNFDYWYPEARLDSLKDEGFDYICEPKLEDYINDYMADVMERANDTTKGMMYIHCWNGWHQSGLLSAYTLMQFCDYSNYEALKYWETCTDGNYRGFSKVKSKIRNFRPLDDYFFTEEQQKRYCPCEKDVSGPSDIQSDDDKINLSVDEMMQKESSTKSYAKHKVRSGESLGVIAEKYGMSVAELQRINGIRGTTIYAGQSLKIVDHKGVLKTEKKSSDSGSSSSSKTYKVRSGDSLYSIAQRHHSTIDAIKKANGLKGDTIYPGQTLKIP